MMRQLIDKKSRILLYIIFLVILSTTNNKFTNNQKNYSTKINKIEVSGLSNSDNLQILNKLDSFLYKSIFIISKEEINKIFSDYNIVEEYRIKKIYPSGLNIIIKPTNFIARIPSNKKLLVGSNGKLITNKMNIDTLPYLFGEFNSEEFLKFKKDIDKSSFNFADFKSMSFYQSKRWDILTINDILIKLPQDQLSKALNQAYIFIKDNEFFNSKVIDLRISNQLIVQ